MHVKQNFGSTKTLALAMIIVVWRHGKSCWLSSRCYSLLSLLLMGCVVTVSFTTSVRNVQNNVPQRLRMRVNEHWELEWTLLQYTKFKKNLRKSNNMPIVKSPFCVKMYFNYKLKISDTFLNCLTFITLSNTLLEQNT